MLGFDFSLATLAVRRRTSVSPVAALAPAAWYDPSDLTTLFQDAEMTTPISADGQVVAAIRDKSGNGWHLTQATAAKRPVFHMLRGKHWLEFDGIDDAMSNTAMALMQPLHVSLGVNVRGGGDYATIFGGGASGRSDLRIRGSGAIESYAGTILSTASSAIGIPSGAIVVSSLFDGANSQIYRNGAQVATGNAGFQPLSGGGFLGCRYDGSLPVQMDFYGAVLLDSVSDTARSQVATWLAEKSGATL